MGKEIRLTENDILSIIESNLKTLMEDRKFIRVPQSQPAPQATAGMPPQDFSTSAQGQMADPTMMQGMGNDANAEQMPQGEMGPEGMPGDAGVSEFDTNFDAGVEADEDADPQKYIQQLTGKLSQTINSYNNENGADPGLNKYVVCMIVAATCKNLDEKAKKEVIEKINSATSDEELPDEEEMGGDMGDTAPEDEGGEPDMPVNEAVFTKKNLIELFSVNKKDERPKEVNPSVGKKTPKAWRGKF